MSTILFTTIGGKSGTFEITHVLIIAGPPKYRDETRRYEGKVFKADKLPAGFEIKPSFGGQDAFLTYKSDGTVGTACSRNFFQKKGRTWLRWPFLDNISPMKAARRNP